ncbi:tetratricopeptide repeat protein [Streptosporangium sp. NPDC020145]|uniref:tetratricopeptide repeat protein n=1 Tax=Streptosporangium sp. NPDC020145 TaxID=3154694 RepID=UPI00342FAF1C
MEFRILGPVELWSSGQRHDLGQAKTRLVLAILLMTPGRPVTVESLVHKVWGDGPPPKAKDSLYSHVARLRGSLNGTVHLRRHAGAYLLETDPENIDYHRFLRLRAQARESETTEQALHLYREADALHRGEALTGLTGPWAEQTREKIEGEVLDSRIERIELEIQHGQKPEDSAELVELVNKFPFREKLVELHMRRLCHEGRPTEALNAYNRARQELRELGTEPNPALQELHLRVLKNDPTLLPAPRKEAAPNTLPRDKQTFTGRTAELDQLVGFQARRDTVTVLAIDGMAGVGKTALAVHLAHRLTGDYPDGQLYLDLHGHDAQNDAMDPATALDRLLRDLGIPGKLVPNGLDGRAAMWRAELARRKVLILLDNAARHDQISDLLPGTPGSLVVITSRRRLAGLDDVHSLSLNVLPPEDGAVLLRRIAGPGRAFQEEGVASVVRLCGHLPLAIQLVGSRLKNRAAWDAADIAELLSRTRRRLPAIKAGNREITAAFELSFHALDERLKQAFWRLGLHPGADLTPESASALLDTSLAEAEEILDEFVDHHLIDEPRKGRYRFHDLIREYALLLSDREPEASRTEVLGRAFDHYLLTADAADRLLYPYRARDPLGVPCPPSQVVEFDSADQASTWMEAELDNLVLIVHHGWAKHAALLAHVLSRHLDLLSRWAEGAALHERATTIYRELNDRSGLAYALADLGMAQCQTGQYDEALLHVAEAMEIQRAAGNQRAIGELLDQSGVVHWQRSEYDVAFGYFEQALQIRRTVGDRNGQANTLNNIAVIHWHRGDYPRAAERMWEAFGMYQEDHDLRGQQVTMNNIGYVEVRFGHYEEALRHYEKAASLNPNLDPRNAAIRLNNLAYVYQYMGRYAEAFEYYQKSLEGHRRIGDRWYEAEVLNNIGSYYMRLGKNSKALAQYQTAMSISIETANQHQHCIALRGIGTTHLKASRNETAIFFYKKSLELAQRIGDVYEEACALDELGTAFAQTGEQERSKEHWRHALGLYERLGVVEAGPLRARLNQQETSVQSH